VLLLRAVTSLLSDVEELRVSGTILIGGVCPIRDGVSLSCDVRGARGLTGRLSHVLEGGVVFTVGVVAEARVLKGVLAFRAMDVGLGRLIETDGLSVDNFGIGWWAREGLIGEAELWRSQVTTF